MSLRKTIQVILFFALLITSTFAAASDSSSSEAKFAMKALPFLQVSGYPWTQESAQGFMRVVNEECGYRGMQIFLAMLREKFTEADQEKIEFACPVLSLVDMSAATISDPLGMGASMVMQDAKSVRSIFSIPKAVINWVVGKIAKAFGKNTAKKVEKELNQCDISLSTSQKLANLALDAVTFGLLKACGAGG